MNITSVTNTQTAKESYMPQKANANTENSTKSNTGVYQSLGTDTFEKSTNDDYPETYKPASKKKLSNDEISALKDEQKNNELDLIKKFVTDTVNKQNNISSTLSQSTSDLLKSVFGSIDKAYPPIATTQEEAQKAISDDGPYSVKSVSERIMKLARVIAGDDPEKIEKMKNAVEKGFASAGLDFKKATKSKLPQICEDTHTEILKRFDDWQKEVSEKNSSNDKDSNNATDTTNS